MKDEDTSRQDNMVGPRRWVPTAEILKKLRDLPPDPSLVDEIRELSGTLEDLGDPWER
jgi:hypothetical protein